MTEKEVIKSMEKCVSSEDCCECLEFRNPYCMNNVMESALDLIKRQQERMDEVVKSLESQIDGYREYYPDDYIFETYDMIDLCKSVIRMIKGDVNDR